MAACRQRRTLYMSLIHQMIPGSPGTASLHNFIVRAAYKSVLPGLTAALQSSPEAAGRGKLPGPATVRGCCGSLAYSSCSATGTPTAFKQLNTCDAKHKSTAHLLHTPQSAPAVSANSLMQWPAVSALLGPQHLLLSPSLLSCSMLTPWASWMRQGNSSGPTCAGSLRQRRPSG